MFLKKRLSKVVNYRTYITGEGRKVREKNTTTTRAIREAELGETNLAATRQYQDEGVDAKDKTSLSLITWKGKKGILS